ncbi:hypothetical protein BDP27DRAFT_653417 [Rhodocollybia butyracea]|uniref:Uncharacterized protein n=1 Tax=Rhodocollybia butyracea TaxID=206335 RepID=A0A9P5PPY1_9AGAR|nr:hypothetical protein BDP27DRAFT_653417 [Rhodocollybia butyracea]
MSNGHSLPECRVDSKTVTNELEIEAKTLVENFFKAGVKHSKTKSRSKNCSILHVMIESYGCTADASYLSNGLLSATDALAALPKILKNPQGTSRFGILYHYSSLVNWNLPQTVVIPQEVFYKIHEMRDIYLDLQTDLEHPALQSEAYFGDRARARLAIISFEQKRKNLVRNWKLERKPKRLQDTELYSQMAEAKLKTNRLMRRYEFIARIKAMKREWTRSSNPGITKDTREFVWECGKVQGGKILKKLANYTRLTFGAGFEAYEVEWQSPLTTSPNAFKKMIGQPKSTMNFIQIDRPVDGKKRRIKEEDEKKDGGFFDFRLVDAKVYVIGWKISCVWEGKPEPGPLIQLDDGEPNFILSDRFSVTLDTSYPARWRCKVLFVFQLSYNFPDLKLDQRNPEPDLDELYSVRD